MSRILDESRLVNETALRYLWDMAIETARSLKARVAHLRETVATTLDLIDEMTDVLTEAGVELLDDGDAGAALTDLIEELDELIEFGCDPALRRYWVERGRGLDTLDEIRDANPAAWPAFVAVHDSFERRFPGLAQEIATAAARRRRYDDRLAKRARRALTQMAGEAEVTPRTNDEARAVLAGSPGPHKAKELRT